MLSVIIITKNEAAKIRGCLESVNFADEIVVVDSGSSDNTVEICKEYTDQVFFKEWPGFGAQKNNALALAKGDWVLSLDADERVDSSLQKEILSIISTADSTGTNEKLGYDIPRRSRFCGRFMKHSGWYPDYVLRLFRREHARFSDDKVHEKVIVNGPTGKLRHPITHLAIDSLDQAIEKMNLYSSIAADEKFKAGAKSSILKAYFRGVWAFLKTYLLRGGILDGRQGFTLSLCNAGGTYFKYAKLLELRRNQQAK